MSLRLIETLFFILCFQVTHSHLFSGKKIMLKCLSWLSVAVALLAVAGCDSGPKVYSVTGKVMIAGNPAPENTRVNFEPVGGGESAAGMVDASGNYKLYYGNEGREGAMPGKYKVFLAPDASSEAYMSGPVSGIPGMPGGGPIPKEYLSGQTSPLTVDVPASNTTIDVIID
jgi:hypothetical protein